MIVTTQATHKLRLAIDLMPGTCFVLCKLFDWSRSRQNPNMFLIQVITHLIQVILYEKLSNS